ncbi:MAG: hemolysin family protein [Eubacterium sp.]|nr:hemolysin family protein [Eubacterium sp.]
MGPSDTITAIIIVLLLVLSGFFSSAETALTTANNLKLRSLADNGNKSAKTVLKLREKSAKMLSAILICNNIVNLSASSLVTSFAYRICNNLGIERNTSLVVGISTGVLTLLVLIFGEITPKTTAALYPEKLSLRYGRVILFITRVLTPIIFIVNTLTKAVLFILRIDPNNSSQKITEDELKTFVDVSHEEGVIESEEREMITNIVEFGDTIAKDVMIPRLDINMVEASITYQDLEEEFNECKFARMPVYSESIDNIIGIINLKDFFFYDGDQDSFDINSLIREANFTYEYKNVSELFMEMRKDSIPMTIVLDEYGALSGLITMEDLVEEIVGEIRDEYDEDEEDEIQKIDENEYIVLGSAPTDDLNETLGLPIDSDEYDSISGHVIKLLEHFPNPGESAEDEYATYTVIEAEKNRIDKVHILLKAPETSEDD